MKLGRFLLVIPVIMLLAYACGSTPINQQGNTKEEPVVIKNDSLEYEIIIIDQGFNFYLNSVARPEGYFSQIYLENRNRFYVAIWNNRFHNPAIFNPNIYENFINYDPNINYGYDVNYKLFNYFEFAQQKYRMVLR